MGKKAEDDKTQDSPAEQPAKTPEAKATPEAPAATEQQVQTKLNVDDSKVIACYANFCRVSSTPEEMILDLGLNPQPMGVGEMTIKVSQRISMNHYTSALSQLSNRVILPSCS